jgi:hypothetical protein
VPSFVRRAAQCIRDEVLTCADEQIFTHAGPVKCPQSLKPEASSMKAAGAVECDSSMLSIVLSCLPLVPAHQTFHCSTSHSGTSCWQVRGW